MKEDEIMEAPEKIYIHPDIGGREFLRPWLHRPANNESVEYTRTDAFIEKMAIWFNNNFIVNDEHGVISDSFDTKEEMFEDFKKYIEG